MYTKKEHKNCISFQMTPDESAFDLAADDWQVSQTELSSQVTMCRRNINHIRMKTDDEMKNY